MLKKIFSTDIKEIVSIDVSLLLLRLGAGAFIITHGWPKLLKIWNGNFSFADPIDLGPVLSLILAAFAEGICSLFVMSGFATRLAALPLMVTMFVAAFFAHAGDPFSTKEKSLLFLLIFTFLFFTGPGRYSIDKWLERR